MIYNEHYCITECDIKKCWQTGLMVVTSSRFGCLLSIHATNNQNNPAVTAGRCWLVHWLCAKPCISSYRAHRQPAFVDITGTANLLGTLAAWCARRGAAPGQKIPGHLPAGRGQEFYKRRWYD